MSRTLVAVAGNVCLDLLVRNVEAVGPHRDGWGDNVQILREPTRVLVAGGGAVPAMLLGWLGHGVSLNTNLGRDPVGSMIQQALTVASVQVGEPVGEATATNIIELRPDGGRTAKYYPGEKVDWTRSLSGQQSLGDRQSLTDRPQQQSRNPDWFLASGFGLVDGEDHRVLGEVLAEFQDRGTRTMFDPSPWFEGKVPVASMRALWGHVDLLVGTEEELAVWHAADDPQQLAAELLGAGSARPGPQAVVVKRGRDGAVFADVDGHRGQVSTPALEGASSVGAGDAFNGQLLDGLLAGKPLEESVTVAVATATQVVHAAKGISGAMKRP